MRDTSPRRPARARIRDLRRQLGGPALSALVLIAISVTVLVAGLWRSL